jgi:hypothetical protein
MFLLRYACTPSLLGYTQHSAEYGSGRQHAAAQAAAAAQGWRQLSGVLSNGWG